MQTSVSIEFFPRNFGGNLSRVCLNKMITISFPTIAAIKKYCSSLKIFELYVHEIKSGSTLSLEQEIRETTKGGWKNLLSLQLGGDIPNGLLKMICINQNLLLKFRRNFTVPDIWMFMSQEVLLYVVQSRRCPKHEQCHQRLIQC